MTTPRPSSPCTGYEIDITEGLGRGAPQALSLFGVAGPDRIHPEDREAVQQRVDAALDPRGPGCFASEHRFLHDDGSYQDVLITGRIDFSKDPEGPRPIRITGVVLEAERAARAAAEKLRRGTQILDALLDASPAAIWAKDLEGHFLVANRRVASNNERRADDILGEVNTALARPENAAESSAHDRLVLETGQSQEFEEVLDQADGPHTYLSVRFPIRDERGVPYAVGGVAADITERMRIHAALRESEERARERAEEIETLLRATPAAVYIARDPECRRITGSRFAHAIMRMAESANLSKSAPEAAPAHIRVFHQGKELAPEEMPLQRAARGEEIQGFENELVFADDTRRILYGNAVPLRDRDGQPRGAIGAFLDVTERRLAEQERERLLAREQAARAMAEAESRAKDEFLAIVSHELRTPLNAILGWTQILLGRELPGEALRAIGTIERNARAQARLIDDMLDASRIVAGKLYLDAHPVELIPLVQAVIEAQQPAADAKGICLVADLDPETGPVHGDPHRLQQVISNLVSNALKFTPQRGTVTVTLRREKDELCLRVRDDGAGIAPEFLPFVFQPFRQADGSTSRRYGGLGLGLSIVRHLVELHGGTVGAESPGLGQGSIFTVLLPAAPSGSAAAEAHASRSGPAAALPSIRGARVLVVDDEPYARVLTARLLGDRGAVVRACASAREALDDLVAWRPDVLVSDIGMPEHDGYWLMERVRALPKERGGATPALALTAHARVTDRVRSLACGYQLHVRKPLEVEELIASVAALLDGRSGSPAA